MKMAVNNEEILFSILDYVVFIGMVVFSGIIGIYFGCFGNKQIALNDYLFGGKNMKTIPIILSLISSFVSGVTMIIIPTEIYQYGPYYWMTALITVILSISSIYATVPVFYKLQLTSTFEYLKLRFDKKTQKLASIYFTISSMFIMPFYLYSPAMTLSLGTNINLYTTTIVLSLICIFYTTIGGFKAVIWTDVLQLFIMFLAIVLVIITGTIYESSITDVFKIAYEGDRLTWDFDINPTKRDTFWTATIGYTFLWIGLAVIPTFVQKCLALPNFKDVKRTGYWFGIGVGLFTTMCVYTGFMCYAKFHNCDPKMSGKIKRIDQLLPYYILGLTGNISGFSGLFFASIFSASLSSVSSYLNALSATIYKDFIENKLVNNVSEIKVNIILKSISFIVGIICIGLIFVMERMGDMQPLIVSLCSMVCTPMVSIFLMGLFFPKCNAKGAFWGSIISSAVLIWLCIGNYYYKFLGYKDYNSKKKFSIEECNPSVNLTTLSYMQKSDLEPFFAYKISFYWYGFIGIWVSLITGLIISTITKDTGKTDRALISPLMHWTLPKEKEDVKLLQN